MKQSDRAWLCFVLPFIIVNTTVTLIRAGSMDYDSLVAWWVVTPMFYIGACILKFWLDGVFDGYRVINMTVTYSTWLQIKKSITEVELRAGDTIALKGKNEPALEISVTKD